jgi:membrane protein implicated in regulation of membrane protease activity
MKDFLRWINDDAGLLISFLFMTLVVMVVFFCAAIVIYLTSWSLANGYWIVLFIPPTAVTWIILHAYKKSKEEQDE